LICYVNSTVTFPVFLYIHKANLKKGMSNEIPYEFDKNNSVQ